MERTIEHLKAVFAEEKSVLSKEILTLEEKIEEVTNLDNIKDSSY